MLGMSPRPRPTSSASPSASSTTCCKASPRVRKLTYIHIHAIRRLPLLTRPSQSAADVRLEDSDKAKWLEWTKMNVLRHWDGDEGPIQTSDVIVIDDPQGKFSSTSCFDQSSLKPIRPAHMFLSSTRSQRPHPLDPAAEPQGQDRLPLPHRDPRGPDPGGPPGAAGAGAQAVC